MKPKPFRPEPFDGAPNYVRDDSGGQVWHRCHTRVLYADTDRSQVVYHGNYLRYFEFGRASLMRDAGYPYKAVEENGFVYPIIEIGLKYFSPLHYDDPIWVNTRPAEITKTSPVKSTRAASPTRRFLSFRCSMRLNSPVLGFQLLIG